MFVICKSFKHGSIKTFKTFKNFKRCGFLYVRRQETWAYYGINDELLKLHLDIFDNIKNLELKNAIKNENIIIQICL